MQTATKLKKIGKIFCYIVLVIYLLLALFDKFVTDKAYGECEKYTLSLNGGVKVYQGKQYKIVLCGDGGDSNQNNDHIRMQIRNQSGSLLAQRRFVIDWDSPNAEKKLIYDNDRITYFDMSDENKSARVIAMPPAVSDWIRARIPLVD